MNTPLRILLLAATLLVPSLGCAQVAPSAVVKTSEVRAELVAHAPDGLAAGKTAWLGLLLEHRPHWHTYWKNPGDSGLPTRLDWKLAPGATAGEIDWPVPSQLPVGPLMNYGYEGRVLLPVPLTIAPSFRGASLDVQLSAQWLVCKDICIPQQGDFRLTLPAQGSTATQAAAFAAALAARPQELAGAQASAEIVGDARALRITVAPLPPTLQGRPLRFFSEMPGVLNHAAKVVGQWDGARWQADVPVSPQRFESPARMAAVLVAPGHAAGVRVEMAVQGLWPAVPAAGAGSLSTATTVPTPRADLGLGLALVFAFIGGVLLNLMPCVFPILSLKVLGFAGHAHSRRALAAGGFAYGTGVVLSFVSLAAVLMALRAGGEQIGWGFQLQSPPFVAALAVLFTVIALNLAGLFEFGTLLPSGAASLRLRHPLADSFLTGVLTVAVASPCTAPFMGAALGLAFTLPPVQTLALFAMLGAGMALPYVMASLWPGIARLMPRPGPWMATFRTVMAFPMLATVVWLVWVLGQQTGIDGVTALLGVLVALAFALWAGGRVDSAPASRRIWNALGLLLLGASLAWAVPSWREARAAADAPGAHWEAWSAERVATLNGEGRTAFVDFTAAWCVTCQVNKRTTLGSTELRAEFERRNIALLRADWTRRDAAISRELARLGRNGVPVYALYRPGQPVQLLPELLTTRTVLDALKDGAP